MNRRWQVCRLRLETPGDPHAEGAYARPLGLAHDGSDVAENVLCLCPNHHALFDYFAIALDPSKLRLNKHALGPSFVAHHNSRTEPKAT